MGKVFTLSVWVMIIGLLVLSACTNQELDELEPIVNNSPNLTVATSEVRQTLSPTPTLTRPPSTPKATMIIETTANAPISSTVLPTDTLLVPTLSVEEVDVFLRELMTNIGECELPCWWGVTPGQTTESMARDLFLSWGLREWVTSDGYRIVTLGYARSDFPHYFPDISTQLWVEDNVVQYILVSGQIPNQELEHQFSEDWQQYSLFNLLEQYGMPTYVRLEGQAPDGSQTAYILGIAYPSVGIEINYVIDAEYVDEQYYSICPDFENFIFISLDLYPPEWSSQVPEYLIQNNLEDYMSWEIATGNNIETFYEMYHQNVSEIPCITLTD